MLACSRAEMLAVHTVVCFACFSHSLTVLHRRYTAKFSVRPPHENVDVNLTVAWWGNARANAV